ncbi:MULTISPECIES: hypothetical protein [Rhodomicrobium]|uniref:hypothetical protein n=1 Tax=Rhodomicrobium TaxID=1068 RepID=UPI000B4B3DC9|nr:MULTISPECIES: hypothetical protein [Rhodomicrobium]
MIKSLKLLAAAGALLASASIAGAAPGTVGQGAPSVGDGLTRVHGCHASCERGPGGWHRHVGNHCARRPCREWRGKGRRPDSCVKVGPVWFCDY